jgi:hypothetical protein
LKLFGPNHCWEPTFLFHYWVLQTPGPFTNKTTLRRYLLKYLIWLINF